MHPAPKSENRTFQYPRSPLSAPPSNAHADSLPQALSSCQMNALGLSPFPDTVPDSAKDPRVKERQILPLGNLPIGKEDTARKEFLQGGVREVP